MYYDSRDKHRWDNQNVFDYAIESTTIETNTKVASKMKNKGYSVTEIAEITNLQVEEIDKLQPYEVTLIDEPI